MKCHRGKFSSFRTADPETRQDHQAAVCTLLIFLFFHSNDRLEICKAVRTYGSCKISHDFPRTTIGWPYGVFDLQESSSTHPHIA